MEEVTANYWEVFGSHLINKVELIDVTNALDVGTGWFLKNNESIYKKESLTLKHGS